jgi:ADP-ribose pyrophosphatase
MNTNGPWKIKSSETKYKNQWIEVIEDKVIRPDGSDGIYGVVRKGPGVMILPFDNEGNVYLIEEFKYPIGKDLLEVCAGALDESEDSLSAAKRELKEELGIEADEWIDLGMEYPFTSVMDAPCGMYIARGLHFGETNTEGTETIVMKKMPFDEAVQKVLDGTIAHAECGLFILKAKMLLDSRSV